MTILFTAIVSNKGEMTKWVSGMAKKSLRMSSYAEKKRKLQEEEEKAKAVVSVIVQFQTADVVLRVLF